LQVAVILRILHHCLGAHIKETIVFDAVLWILGTLYAAGILLFAVGAWRARYRYNRSLRPKVSIIVAARNEELNIRRCLDSLMRLTYPPELLEVIIVNDRSTDATPDIIREFTARRSNIHLLNARVGLGHLRGKANAISQGIETSTGEIILMTDADCTLPPGWVEDTAKYYVDRSVGIVPGFTAIRHDNMFEAMQTLDWFALFSVAASATKLGFPVTAVGNNFTIRRSAYDAVGGYAGIPFSVTEDYALFHAVTSGTSYRACFPLDPSTVVESEPCKTWRDLYRQRKRWFAGGRDMDARSISIFASAWLLNAMILAGLFIEVSPLLVSVVVLKMGVDFALVLPAIAAFRRWELLSAFPLYAIYYFFYVLIYPPIVLIGRNVVWKDQQFGNPETPQPS
jgi:cellulose synthase/poly-beta-1,6-N-acetylglucosamine synthase-like glycosyltransferase